MDRKKHINEIMIMRKNGARILDLSNGYLCGIEELDLETAKYISKSKWKEILNNR